MDKMSPPQRCFDFVPSAGIYQPSLPNAVQFITFILTVLKPYTPVPCGGHRVLGKM